MGGEAAFRRSKSSGLSQVSVRTRMSILLEVMKLLQTFDLRLSDLIFSRAIRN